MSDFNLAQILYEEGSLGVFILVTIVLGGGAAYLAGRAIAATWRPWWHVVFYMLVLGLFVRFLHFALFDGTLIEPHYYAVDSAFCLFFGLLGYRVTRAGQMATQYRWLYGRSGPLTWTRR
ncbi:MAG TPA: hypothetical protein VHA55_01370 [Pseudorhodoplanes sp.]|nr:hypothetical protein [Pseudorhodoplanes sp.]